MKKFILFIVILCPFISRAQDLDSAKERYFQKIVYFRPGIDYKGQKVLLGLSKGVTEDDGIMKYYSPTNEIPYQIASIFSNSDSITNKSWRCLDVLPGQPGYTVLKLQQVNNNFNIIYYNLYYIGHPIYTDEDLKEDANNKLEESKRMTELQAEIDNPCSQIDYSYDKFHYTKNYNTSTTLPQKIADTSYEKDFNAVFYKQISNSHTVYYLSLNTTSSLPDALRRGVIVILKNGKRLNKPLARVETTVEEQHNEAVYVVKSFFTLTSADLVLIKSSPLSEFELYTDQDEVRHPEIVYKMFLCLLDKK